MASDSPKSRELQKRGREALERGEPVLFLLPNQVWMAEQFNAPFILTKQLPTSAD